MNSKTNTKLKISKNNSMTSKVKSNNNKLYPSYSKTIKISKKAKEVFNKNIELRNSEKVNNINKYTTPKFNKDKLEKKISGRCSSAKPKKIQVRNNSFNKNLYDKLVAFKKKEKNKNLTNSAITTKKTQIINKENSTNNNKSKEYKILYINEKDLNEITKESLYSFINIVYIHGQIEYEIIDIIKNSIKIQKQKDIYVKLYELSNNIFEKISFYSNKEINIYKQNNINKLVKNALQLLLSYHSILFVNIILLSVYDSITVLNNQYNAQFKKVSKIIYNIFYNFTYTDFKNCNILQNFSDYSNICEFFDNSLNKLIEKNKYKIVNNNKSENNEFIIMNLNKLIDTTFSELKEITETMRLSPIAPVAYSLKLLINSFGKKTLSSYIDIIDNVILYSILNKNIKLAYKNMLADLKSGNEVVYSRNSVPYLPEISKDKKYTLVLDLDETLIHFFSSKVEIKGDPHYGYYTSDEEYGTFNNYLLNGEIEKHYEFLRIGMFLLRPYVKQFLSELNNFYEIVIFTTGTKEYCDRVLQLLDLDNNLIKYRLYKHHINLKYINTSVKDLSLLGRDLNKTIIIDNLEENFRLQPDNGLPIITWKGDINDYSLKYLAKILKNIVIKKVSDVRRIIKKIKAQIKSEKNPSYSKVNINDLF